MIPKRNDDDTASSVITILGCMAFIIAIFAVMHSCERDCETVCVGKYGESQRLQCETRCAVTYHVGR